MRLTYRVKGTRTVTRITKIGPNRRYRKTIKLNVSARTKIGATLRISQRFTGTKTVTPGNGQTLRSSSTPVGRHT